MSSDAPSFGDVFRAVWGYDPFPWQETLAERVVEEGWPAIIDVPTGGGKTAVLDIALYHLVRDGGRRAPRRIVLVVDRRVIVDQVSARALEIRAAIERADSAPTRFMREALRALVGGSKDPLLETAVLRGASLRDDAWARRPHVPVLAASTVDQIGSRLFFRGYGVSASMRPIHAGLVGCDTLLLLDEVHLARPFASVMEQLAQLRGDELEHVPRRFGVVQLSATPGTTRTPPFQIGAADREHPTLSARLRASKPAHLTSVKVGARADRGDQRETVAKEAAKQALAMVAEGRTAVAVVVNRVDTARRVWQLLDHESTDRALLTGRMRPLDQQRALKELLPRVAAGRAEGSNSRPLIIVATQCIEAGADFDFDGLVTECASLDALRQRFGRLDRRGERTSRAVILGRSDLVKDGSDPIYGQALTDTWAWLEMLEREGQLDFGIEALAPHLEALGDRVAQLCAPSREPPVIMPAYLDQWSQTNPPPHADPDPSLFLHGIPEDARSTVPDVQVVWRADLAEEDLAIGPPPDWILDRLSAVPPGALEALSLPVWSVHQWLVEGFDHGTDDIADVDGQRQEAEEGVGDRRGLPVLRWSGRDSQVIPAEQVEPGMLVIVPASRGGIGLHGTFEPSHADRIPVADLGDVVQLVQRGRPSLRLLPEVAGTLFQLGSSQLSEGDEVEDGRDRAAEWLEVILDATPADIHREWAVALQDALQKRRLLLLPNRDGSSIWMAAGAPLSVHALRALLARVEARGSGLALAEPAAATTEAEDENGSFTGRAVALEAHLRGVGETAARFAAASGLSPTICSTLAWAGRAHDVGKVDPRFQLWLHGGDEVAAATEEHALAKSPIPTQNAAARRRARELAGYAVGQRHELVSLDMLERSEALRELLERDGVEWELFLHLVASHHGWCRPVAPPATIRDGDDDFVTWRLGDVEIAGHTAHGRARMGSGVVDRFWRLQRKYGWHELAYLEAILRLADHRQSADEQEGAA